MARGPNVVLGSFGCFTCGKRLGWTAEGEAKRMNTRARLYCDTCKDVPADLTERQVQVLERLRAMTERGERANVSAVAKDLDMSVGRAHQIITAIRARGMGDLVDEAMGKGPAESRPAPRTEIPAVVVTPANPVFDPDHHVVAAAEGGPQFVNPDGSPTAMPVFTPPVVPPAGTSNPTDHDPAAAGASFA